MKETNEAWCKGESRWNPAGAERPYRSNQKQRKMKTNKNYKAYIAGSNYSKAFDSDYGKTPQSAIAAIKRRNSPDWQDCAVWVVYVHDNGQEEKIN